MNMAYPHSYFSPVGASTRQPETTRLVQKNPLIENPVFSQSTTPVSNQDPGKNHSYDTNFVNGVFTTSKNRLKHYTSAHQLHGGESSMKLEDLPHQEWLKEQDLTQRQIEMLLFQHWMREETNLDSGTIVEYRKKIHQLMDEDSKLVVDREQLSTRENTAVNKFQEYIEAKKPVKSGKGGSGE